MNNFLTSAISGYSVHLPAFEGPLDLLLHLIRQNEIDIYDIPIAKITDQYIEYMALMDALDLDLAGEFIVMAATLLEIKSKLLLPLDPKDESGDEPVDPRAELVERLIEYARFKEAADIFREHEDARKQVFVRGATELDYTDAAPPVVLKDITATDLLASLLKLLADVGAGEEDVTSIARRKITVRMKMSEIWRRVANRDQGVFFEELFEDENTRYAVVTTFLALLELLRLQKVGVRQSKAFDRIEIFRYNQPREL